MKKICTGPLLIALGLVFLASAYALLMASYVSTPDEFRKADFIAFYSAGRVGREYGLGKVYDLQHEAEAQAQVSGVSVDPGNFLTPNHPPFLYPFLSLLAGWDYRTAYFGYALLLVLLVLTGLPALYLVLRQNGWPRLQTWEVLVGVLTFEPFFISILKGQDSAVLLAGGLLWFCGLCREDDLLAGLGLSLTLIRPQIAILLAFPMFFKRRKAFGWFCLGGLGLGFYSFLLVGWGGAKDYLHLLAISSNGAGFGLAETAMFNFTGLIMRITSMTNAGVIHALGWGLFGISLIGLCVFLWRSKKIGHTQVAALVCVSLFASPHLHYHDLALLAVPLLGLSIVTVKAGRLDATKTAGLLVMTSLILLAGEWFDLLRWTFPYLLMAGLPVLIHYLEKRIAPERLAP